MRRKIGILGLGSIGSRHSKNFKELGCAVLGYDPREHDSNLTRKSLIEWADAIVVATPTSNHHSDLLNIPLGMPVLVEKPIVSTRMELQTVYTKGVKMVGYNLRFHSCVRKAREWLGVGHIGKPIWARFTCAQYNDKPDYLRDGVILNWSHEIDLALHLLGSAVCTGACIHRAARSAEDIADINLLQLGDCLTTVHLDYRTRWERRGFLIVGDRGSIEADLVSRQAFYRDNTGRFLDTYYGRDSYDGNYLAEARAFLSRLDGHEVDGCTAEEAMKVAEICFDAKEKALG